jgi:hypothetical protein
MHTLAIRTLGQDTLAVHFNHHGSCLALIWAKGLLTRRRWNEAMATLRRQPGVESVLPSLAKASVFLVRFDRDWTTALTIVNSLNKAGFSARLIGC